MTEQCYDRLTILETVYHRPYMDEVLTVDTRFSRVIETGEQPYQRQCHKSGSLSTEQWKQLDFGWLKDNVGMFVVANDEGKYLEIIPTDEERKEIAKRVIEIGYASVNDIQDFVWFVPPEESFRGSPSNPSRLWIRCQHGEAKYTLTAFPK